MPYSNNVTFLPNRYQRANYVPVQLHYNNTSTNTNYYRSAICLKYTITW